MKVKVRIFGDIANVIGSKHVVELEPQSTIINLTNRLQRKAGQTRLGYLRSFKVGGPDLAILVNGRNIQLLDGVETKLHDGDEVVITPYVVGG